MKNKTYVAADLNAMFTYLTTKHTATYYLSERSDKLILIFFNPHHYQRCQKPISHSVTWLQSSMT